MGLFKNDKSVDEYYNFKESREKFTKKNNEMTETIQSKTIDPENVDYSKVHVEIYNGVGLGKEWRVDKSENSQELDLASNGFTKVTKSLKPYSDKSIFAKRLLERIISFFKKE